MKIEEIIKLRKLYLEDDKTFFDKACIELKNSLKRMEGFFINKLNDEFNLLSLYDNLRDDEDSLKTVLDTFSGNKNRIIATIDYKKEKYNLYEKVKEGTKKEIEEYDLLHNSSVEYFNHYPETIKTDVHFVVLYKDGDNYIIEKKEQTFFHFLEPCSTFTYFILLEILSTSMPSEVFIHGIISPDIIYKTKENNDEYKDLVTDIEKLFTFTFLLPNVCNDLIIPNSNSNGVWCSCSDMINQDRKGKIEKLIEMQSED